MSSRIYLDYAATTPVRPEVLAAMMPFFSANAYNPSSIHAEGRAARAALDDARARVAAVIGASPKEIIFTAGGSEADNLAVFGTARALCGRGKHLLCTPIEHHAVLHAMDALRAEGYDVGTVPVDGSGIVDPEQFSCALRAQTVLASVMYVNNEIGTVEPIPELAERAHHAGVLLHTDAVQAAAYLPLNVHALGVDLLSIAAHKVYGPKGTGALFVREGTPLLPMLHGGSQEFSKRAGTQNVAGAVGLAVALELAAREASEDANRLSGLRDRFERAVLETIPYCGVTAAAAPRAPHITSLRISGVDSEQILMRLDVDGVAVSAGSACASGVTQASHVIAALGGVTSSDAVIRVSFGKMTTAPQIEQALKVLRQAVADLRCVSPVPA